MIMAYPMTTDQMWAALHRYERMSAQTWHDYPRNHPTAVEIRSRCAAEMRALRVKLGCTTDYTGERSIRVY